MWRNGLLLTITFLASISSRAQLFNSLTIPDNSDFDRVELSLNATNGQCFIEPNQESHRLDIHSNITGTITPRSEEKIVKRTKQVNIKLEELEKSSLGASFSRRMFNADSDDHYTWKVYLSKLKPLDLDLNYAVGDTYIDLSDLPIERLKMRTGSANVKVNYSKGLGNKLEMDTFLIKVDMGTFEARNLHLCNSSNIIADVGFGRLKIDFEEAGNKMTEVKATVGAGKLEVLLPDGNVPVWINVNDSPLCHIKIPHDFKKASENIFTSPGFTSNETDHIRFNVDVAVGNIVFKASNQ